MVTREGQLRRPPAQRTMIQQTASEIQIRALSSDCTSSKDIFASSHVNKVFYPILPWKFTSPKGYGLNYPRFCSPRKKFLLDQTDISANHTCACRTQLQLGESSRVLTKEGYHLQIWIRTSLVTSGYGFLSDDPKPLIVYRCTS